MQKTIKITFSVKKKNKDDTCRMNANYIESAEGRLFILTKSNRELQRQRHTVTEGCIIEDLINDEVFKCIGVTFTTSRPIYPIMLVEPV